MKLSISKGQHLNFMMAGKDISASSVSWLLYMLCKNPLIQQKLCKKCEM